MSAGVSIKAGYWRSTTSVGPLKAVCLDFINENTNDVNKKQQLQQQQRPLEFLNATKIAHFLMPRMLKITFLNLDFKFFVGRREYLQTPLEGKLQPL